MTTGQIFLVCLGGLLIQFGIIYWAVQLVMERSNKYQKIQTRLMAMMARKAGVPEKDVFDAFAMEKMHAM